jgi:hypothetical protein
MSAEPSSSRAAQLAAEQVEAIVAAAQGAAGGIREEARLELEELRQQADREAESIKDAARKQVTELNADARKDAQAIIDKARKESDQIREQTKRAVEGRVVTAEKAAAEVLAEARALSSGLRQLGQSLSGQAERILSDVQAAHKRMQADLRIAPGLDPEPSVRPRARDEPPRARAERPRDEPARDPELDEKLRTIREGVERADAASARQRRVSGSRSPSRERPNPLDDLDLPSWVER